MILSLTLSAKILSLNPLNSNPEMSTEYPTPDIFCGFNKVEQFFFILRRIKIIIGSRISNYYSYVVPIIRWGEVIQQEPSQGWSRVIQHDLAGKLDGHNWTVEFPVHIHCTYLNEKYEDHGVARHGYAADAPFTKTPRDARYHYLKTLRY